MSDDTENQLEQTLIKAQSDPAFRPQFYRELVASDVYFIEAGVMPEEKERRIVSEGETLKIVSMEWEGKSYLPIFSSLERLQKYIQREVGYISMNALEFMKLTNGAELLLNPESDFGKELIKEEIASIIDGSIWQSVERYVVQKPAKITIGQPTNYPTQLAEALADYFEQIKEVKKAYLAHFLNPERDQKAHTLIAVEIESGGDFEKIMSAAGMIVSGIHVPDPPVDFIRLDGKAGLEDYFLKSCKPFYKKKRLGLF